jgi:hypothetical protein
MKKAFVILVALGVAIGLTGCGNAEEKALQSAAPPPSQNATAPTTGKDTSSMPALDEGAAQQPALKPEGY